MEASINENNEPYLTPQEAADYIGVALGTVYNKVSHGTIPFSRRGRILRFRRSELDAWLNDSWEKPADPAA